VEIEGNSVPCSIFSVAYRRFATLEPMPPKTSLAWFLLLSCAHGAFIRYWPCDLDEDVLSAYQF
jgi:hypothetical protein